MHAVIVGCGRVGTLLAQLLEQDGHQVAIVDKNPLAFRRLGPGFRGRTVTGVGFDRDTLREAGIERADAFAAVTSGDNSNFISAVVARDTFQVPMVVARIYDPQREQIYRRIGIRTISSTEWGANKIKRLLLHKDLDDTLELGNGEVHVMRVQVGPHTAGRSIHELTHDNKVCVFGLVRNGQATIPVATTQLLTGDILHLSAHANAIDRLQDLIA